MREPCRFSTRRERGFPAWRGSYSSAVTPFTSTPSTMAAISRGEMGISFYSQHCSMPMQPDTMKEYT